MKEKELQQVFSKVTRELAHDFGIELVMDYNLKTKKADKRIMASLRVGWTLCINKKGSMCHAVKHTGAILIIESPEHMHGLRHPEHAANFFINYMRDLAAGLHKS